MYSDHFSSSSGLRVSVSNMGGANQWRKESVTIIESQEPMEEDTEENEGDVESDGADKEPVAQTRSVDMKYKKYFHAYENNILARVLRRLSCSVESSASGEAGQQVLVVPSATITASSSAETLTDNTITAPSTPTNLTCNRWHSLVLLSTT